MRQLLKLTSLACLLLGLQFAVAEEVMVNTASTYTKNGVITLDTNISFDLGEDVIEALNSGVVLTFDLLIRIEHPREWLWSETTVRSSYRYQLQYHALSDQYLLTDLINNKQRVLQSEAEALQALGRLQSIAVTDEKNLLSGQQYQLIFSLQLDIEALPAPMRPIAYLTPQWHISSDDYEILLTP